MSNIIILFGEMGGGKNYWGEQMAEQLGYAFFDGDDAATPDMIARVSKFKPLTREIVQHYINQLTSTIVEMARYDDLVIAQALYFDQDRRYIHYILTCLGHRVTFKWVKPGFWQNLKQVYSRPRGLRWALYWLMNKPFFQKPTHDYEQV